MFFLLGVVNNPFLVQIGHTKTIFKKFYQPFLRTNGFQHKLLKSIESPNIFQWKSAKKVYWVWSLRQNLGQIRSNVVKKYKETGHINELFSNFAWGIDLKEESSGYRNIWVEIGDQTSKIYHNLKKIRTKFLPCILGQK